MRVWTQILLLSGLIMNFDGITWIKQPQPDAPGDTAEVSRLVAEILGRVRAEGDAAVADYSRRFDRSELRSLASASKAVLGSVAGSVAESVVRETRDQARTLVDRRRAHRLQTAREGQED